VKILNKQPKHPETLGMKALFQVFLGQNEQGLSLIKESVKLNFKSKVIWHLYGIIQKHLKNWEEAAKCYKWAVKFDPDNLQILKELSVI